MAAAPEHSDLRPFQTGSYAPMGEIYRIGKDPTFVKAASVAIMCRVVPNDPWEVTGAHIYNLVACKCLTGNVNLKSNGYGRPKVTKNRRFRSKMTKYRVFMPIFERFLIKNS